MTATLSNLFHRDDTFLGICQAIGDDFGFNPNWLRIALALPLLVNMWVPFALYAVLGVVVLISRMIAPVRSRSVATAVAAPVAVAPVATPAPANETEELALAA